MLTDRQRPKQNITFLVEAEVNEKALREMQTLRTRALAVVRFGHHPPARPPSQTHRQDRLQYTALQLASTQRNKATVTALPGCSLLHLN